jgi:hypothetical protein
MPRSTKHFWLVGLIVALTAVPAFGRPPVRRAPRNLPPMSADVDAAALAERIDRRLAERWKGFAVEPAPLVDDATFHRRACLDLHGRIPDIVAARDFLENPDPNKRIKLIEKLLGHPQSTAPSHPRYAEHMANVYGLLLAPPSNDPMRPRAFTVEQFLMKEFDENTPYDALVRKILLAQPGDQFAGFFYQANEFKPENMAGSVSRLFLGFKLECAQCHDHPHDVWTRKQFWEFAAFFGGIQPNGQPQPSSTQIAIPGQGKIVQARFPDGTMPNFRPGVPSTVIMTEWLTSNDNPYFARAAVNRVWEYFFGIGIVDPVDERSEKNQPSHPELLDELARAFIAHKYDLKYLIRTIMMTQAYQRSSRLTHPSQVDGRLFARMQVRGLSSEQLYDSLAQVVRYEAEPTFGDHGRGVRGARMLDPARAEFLTRFPPGQERRTEHQTSILQALYLMNGKLVGEATSLESNKNLRHIANDTKSKPEKKIQQLYLLVLSRKPRPDELERLVPYVESGGATGDSRKALSDVFWALLNSSEFALNH